MDANEFFKEVTRRICGSLDIELALSETFEFFKRVMPVDAMGLMYMDIPGKRLTPVAWCETEGLGLFGTQELPDIRFEDDYLDFLKDNPKPESGVQIINSPKDVDPQMVQWFPLIATYSSMSLYLNVRGEVVGKLIVAAKGADRYTNRDATLFATVQDPVAIAMSNARRYLELVKLKDALAEDNRALVADLKRASGVEVVGADFGLRGVMDMVRQIAPSPSPALLLGETGTGKEVIANAIHMASPRSNRPMVTIQCGAIPETLLDSELFGHEKGAFTGASDRKRGRFERADGGTLFLDEIGELSLDAQVKLLRVLQEKKFERVGGSETIEADVRVIAATHRDLEAMVRKGTFREDLWYRLNVLPIRIPPLRVRREDIPSLVQYFVEQKAQEMNLIRIPRVDRHSLERLKGYDWPGNVRELQNIVERALILCRGDRLEFPALGGSLGRPSTETPATRAAAPHALTLDEAMEEHIRSVLKIAGGQVAGKGGAAEILNMNPSTLRFRIKKLGITQ